MVISLSRRISEPSHDVFMTSQVTFVQGDVLLEMMGRRVTETDETDLALGFQTPWVWRYDRTPKNIAKTQEIQEVFGRFG